MNRVRIKIRAEKEKTIMKNVPMKGIITPILTPMNPDETVNLEVLRQQI